MQQEDTYAIRLHDLYAGGLILISLVILQDFLNISPLDPPAFLAILAFSIALPLLSGTLVLSVVEKKFNKGPSRLIVIIEHGVFLSSILFDVIGIGAAFWHASFITGIAFIAGVVVTLAVYGVYVVNLEEQAPI
jgi:hypothetical protein